MTNEEARREFQKLLEERSISDDKIYEMAIKQGRWEPGLDSNESLFNGTKVEFEYKANNLRSQIDK